MTDKAEVDLSSLRIFLEVSQDCSMSAAAKRLGITQPAISLAIHRLEESLGIVLFDRTSRPIVLTSAGRLLQARSAEIIESIQHLRSELLQSGQGTRPSLSLGCSDSISFCCVPFFASQLTDKTARLSAYTSNTPQVCNMLLNGKVDIAIATDPLINRKEVRSIPTHNEDFIIVAPAEFDGKITQKNHLIELIKHLPVIRFNDLSLDSIQVERVLRQCNVRSPHRIEADTNQMVLSLVAHGCGWTVMPTLGLWVARDFLNRVSLHKIPFVQSQRSAYVLYSSSVFESLAIEISKMVKSTLKEVVIPMIGLRSATLAQSIRVV